MASDYNKALKEPPQVKALFDDLAPRYEFTDHVFSLGLDAWWRHRTAKALAPQAAGPLFDGATGSGQLALSLAKRYQGRRVVGLDFSSGMLAQAQRRIAADGAGGRISLIEGDLTGLPLAEGVFSAATVAFGVRNVADRRACLAEFFRVLQPGGRLVVLEFDLPTLPVIGPLYRWYFGHVMPWIARRLRSFEAYRYLFQSVRAFPPPETFCRMLESAGFVRVHSRAMTLGTVRLYQGEKPAAPSGQTS